MFYIGLINIGKTYKLINVKMPTVVDILTYNSRINTASNF